MSESIYHKLVDLINKIEVYGLTYIYPVDIDVGVFRIVGFVVVSVMVSKNYG